MGKRGINANQVNANQRAAAHGDETRLPAGHENGVRAQIRADVPCGRSARLYAPAISVSAAL